MIVRLLEINKIIDYCPQKVLEFNLLLDDIISNTVEREYSRFTDYEYDQIMLYRIFKTKNLLVVNKYHPTIFRALYKKYCEIKHIEMDVIVDEITDIFIYKLKENGIYCTKKD